MGNISLFEIEGTKVSKLHGAPARVERTLQMLVENNLETLLGIRFIATEYSTGEIHGGRIDSLGIDGDDCPVIIEYKKATNPNVINQGLYYLNWLMDHKAEFTLLVMQVYGNEIAEKINWTNPQLICLANGFNKFDGHAIQQMNRNIKLYEYNYYDDHILMLNLVHEAIPSSAVAKGKVSIQKDGTPKRRKGKTRNRAINSAESMKNQDVKMDSTESKHRKATKNQSNNRRKAPTGNSQVNVAQTDRKRKSVRGRSTVTGKQIQSTIKGKAKLHSEQISRSKTGDNITKLSDESTALYKSLKQFLMSLGDDVQMKVLKNYIAFKRNKNNFVCVVQTKSQKIKLYLKADLNKIRLKKGFSRDVREKGHWGTGDLELSILNDADFEKAKSFIMTSYQSNDN
ncbi:Predicted transport protein [Seinonella peptonophila]|uniref:Predicted transport protein n=1 Tax=Seinonella peptonophila TaxID=112248 RepID=A0A1M4XM44_9BACL|nr:DUF5655 domain-containing protein [Seinonella peptonophila]SHE94501.1 Predicted transport protein [Seinonella peptonophila]